ncbi:MAG: nitrogenase-stabilizing/protective protein NifW [Sulfuricellaceae bacterium]|nr:nitrogenase-stabilizing/protective protein NifW [Sulfuricellaceae bacterium]
MNSLFEQMITLASAEEFLDFFQLEYDQSVVNVNRLHILQRFHQYMRQTKGLSEMEENQQHDKCRELLACAYQDFVNSSAVKEKVFKVFRDAEGIKTISLNSLRDSIPSRNLTSV